MINLIKYNTVQNFYLKVGNNILTHEQIKFALDTLYNNHLQKLSLKDKIIIIFKIHITDDMWKSLFVNQCISMSELSQLYIIFNMCLNVKYDNRHYWSIYKIGFRYMVINPLHIPPI